MPSRRCRSRTVRPCAAWRIIAPCCLPSSCVPWRPARGRQAGRPRTHGGALTRHTAGSRSTATCMSISYPVRLLRHPRCCRCRRETRAGVRVVRADIARRMRTDTARRMRRLPDRGIGRFFGPGRYAQPHRRQASRARQMLLRRFVHQISLCTFTPHTARAATHCPADNETPHPRRHGT